MERHDPKPIIVRPFNKTLRHNGVSLAWIIRHGESLSRLGGLMKFTTLIPRRRNDGSRVSKDEMNSIVTELENHFGGLTREGTVIGHWVDSPTATCTSMRV